MVIEEEDSDHSDAISDDDEQDPEFINEPEEDIDWYHDSHQSESSDDNDGKPVNTKELIKTSEPEVITSKKSVTLPKLLVTDSVSIKKNTQLRDMPTLRPRKSKPTKIAYRPLLNKCKKVKA